MPDMAMYLVNERAVEHAMRLTERHRSFVRGKGRPRQRRGRSS
jgi:hypothetical protein